ncbi:hypothetical protein AMTR_s00037p00098610 [Amborella trichopoda]|uniref:Uncharacterized protein n=1 Tax=Amborella trichopoda TaxID=13333 RepID=U5D518_AMBTC|nr:hypothetical protein AMTR_s00037p00098610 [Amborella trichopoda]
MDLDRVTGLRAKTTLIHQTMIKIKGLALLVKSPSNIVSMRVNLVKPSPDTILKRTNPIELLEVVVPEHPVTTLSCNPCSIPKRVIVTLTISKHWMAKDLNQVAILANKPHDQPSQFLKSNQLGNLSQPVPRT